MNSSNASRGGFLSMLAEHLEICWRALCRCILTHRKSQRQQAVIEIIANYIDIGTCAHILGSKLYERMFI